MNCDSCEQELKADEVDTCESCLLEQFKKWWQQIDQDEEWIVEHF